MADLVLSFGSTDSTFSRVDSIWRTINDRSLRIEISKLLVKCWVASNFKDKSILACAKQQSQESSHVVDLILGDSAFIITDRVASKSQAEFDCILKRGYQIVLLVPEDAVVRESHVIDAMEFERVTVRSIESFLSTSIDFAGGFDSSKATRLLESLAREFNRTTIEYSSLPTIRIVKAN